MRTPRRLLAALLTALALLLGAGATFLTSVAVVALNPDRVDAAAATMASSSTGREMLADAVQDKDPRLAKSLRKAQSSKTTAGVMSSADKTAAKAAARFTEPVKDAVRDARSTLLSVAAALWMGVGAGVAAVVTISPSRRSALNRFAGAAFTTGVGVIVSAVVMRWMVEQVPTSAMTRSLAEGRTELIPLASTLIVVGALLLAAKLVMPAERRRRA